MPAVVLEQVWLMGPPPGAEPMLSIELANVQSVVIDVIEAGFTPGQGGLLAVFTDTAGVVVLRTSTGDLTVPVAPGSSFRAFTA